ncbi:MAG: hypothetical protein WCH99_19535 [Verrucomicrobiota bacterium]
MDITDGETIGGDGLPGPASRNLQGKTKKRLKPETLKPEIQGGAGNLQTDVALPEELVAIHQLINTGAGKWPASFRRFAGMPLAGVVFLFFTVSAGLSCGSGVASHDPRTGDHKTAQVQASTRRDARGQRSDDRGQVFPDGESEGGENKDHELQTMDHRDGGQTAEVERQTADGPPLKIIHTIGRLEYRQGFKDVWVDDVPFDLRPYIKARLCLAYLEKMQAVDANSARHFLDEIDLYVREAGGLGARGKFSEVKIQDYFREPSGRLIKLCQAMIRSAGNGKYYLETSAM